MFLNPKHRHMGPCQPVQLLPIVSQDVMPNCQQKQKFLSIYVQKTKSLHLNQDAHVVGVPPNFWNTKWKAVLCHPPPPFGKQEQVNHKVASSILSVTGTVCWYSCLLLGGERHWNSKASLTEEHNKMTQQKLETRPLNPESSMQSIRLPCLPPLNSYTGNIF